MRPDPRILALDCSQAHCAVALLEEGATRLSETEAMARGQAERLWPMVEALLTRAGWDYASLDAVAVGIGPGSFTGIRLGVAAARGLALALGKPAIGVSMFEVMGRHRIGPATLVSLPGPAGTAYVQPFRGDHRPGEARQIDPADPPWDLQMSFGMTIVGWQAETIARRFEASGHDAELGNVPATIAEIAERRLAPGAEIPAPAPLYVRGPNADPPRHQPPPRIG